MATTHMNRIHSVHSLVRLLKSSTDPPSTPGPSKIEIAHLAWSDPSFRAASKGEIIGEWILTLFGQAKKAGRERDPSSISNSIADSRYWILLYNVLATPPPTTARPIKTWVLPLLRRFQLDTLIIELLSFHSSQVLSSARAALAVLWPLAEKKIGVDALGECLNAVFDACAVWERVDDDLCWVCSAVVGTFRNALANSGDQKKLYNSFLITHLSSWLCVICTTPSLVTPSSTKQLQDSMYAAGTDTLFSLDALKQPLDLLFNALSSSLTPNFSFLPVLPKLFVSFLSATHRHRSALFVTSTSIISGKEEMRKKGMEFAGRCWALIQGSASLQEDFNVEKWRSVIGVFEIVGKERLFIACPVRGAHIGGRLEGESALDQARDKAVEMLENVGFSSEDCRVEQAILSMQLLDVLVRIEYDFIGSVLERALSALINIPPTIFHLVTTPSSELLAHVLDYHVKTRTVHTYVLTLLGAVIASSAASTSWSTTSFPMMTFPLAYHLPALAHALRTSLTPTQNTPLATTVLQAAESVWRAVKDTDQEEERVVKKRNSTGGRDKGEREARMVQAQARGFSYTSSVAGIVLSNLASNAYTEDAEFTLASLWGDAGKLGWTVIWDCLRERTGEGNEIKVKGGDGKKRRRAVETGPPSAHYRHSMASAALRFLYNIRVRVSFLLGDYDHLRELDVETLLNVARDGASEPELVLEIIRTLFWHMWYAHDHGSQKRMKTQAIFTATLDILTTYISSKARWSGVSADLTRDNLGLAILYVLTDRWIDVLDALAPTESLERLVSLLLSVSLNPPFDDIQEDFDEIRQQRDHAVITLRSILLKLVQNAQFWELHNIRVVLLSSILSLTAPLSSDFITAAGVVSPLPAAIAQDEPILACNVYGLLQYVPPEYFTRPVRTELVKRTMARDVQICAVLVGASGKGSKAKGNVVVRADTKFGGESHTEESDDRVLEVESKCWSHRLTFVRVFLQRMGQFLNTASHSTSFVFVTHLLSSSCISSPSNALTTVTLDLIQLHAVCLLRSQEPEVATSISSVISTLIAAGPFSHPSSQETWTHIIVQPTVLKLIERLTSEFDSASLSDEVKRSLKTLLWALESALSPHIQRFVERDATELDQFLCSERIYAWSRILLLARWLGINSQVVSVPFGLKLATSLICGGNSTRLDSETCSSVLRLLFEELWCMPDISHHVHLDVLVAFYTANNAHRDSDQVGHTMDTHVTQASKKLSVGDFSHLLNVLAEGFGGSGLQVGHHEPLIHLGKVILHDAPQGTLKVIQHFVTRCFHMFADRKDIYGGSSSLKVQFLEFIARHCSDRPVAIRSVDLSNIWSFLNRILSGSSVHDSATMFPIFHHIATIIGALIRLRRDLVVHTLPHLSLVLRQLMMLTRKIRPQLGAKQSKIVTDTFPSWLSASQPLSTNEARALARLLTSLTNKTVPRVHAYAHPSTSTDSQKAESLAKPFAKHASYVLVAYVDAFNDPLCIMNAEMRRELEPGLFALCEMVGEHSRDALMASALDSGGKTIMKSLWNDYEKQRYVGKG